MGLVGLFVGTIILQIPFFCVTGAALENPVPKFVRRRKQSLMIFIQRSAERSDSIASTDGESLSQQKWGIPLHWLKRKNYLTILHYGCAQTNNFNQRRKLGEHEIHSHTKQSQDMFYLQKIHSQAAQAWWITRQKLFLNTSSDTVTFMKIFPFLLCWWKRSHVSKACNRGAWGHASEAKRITRKALLSEADFEKVFRTQNWVRRRKLFCFFHFVSCWGKRGAYRLLLEPSWR